MKKWGRLHAFWSAWSLAVMESRDSNRGAPGGWSRHSGWLRFRWFIPNLIDYYKLDSKDFRKRRETNDTDYYQEGDLDKFIGCAPGLTEGLSPREYRDNE